MKINPTNHDLHVMLTEVSGDMKALMTGQRRIERWQESHQAKEDAQFKDINARINSVYGFGSAIAALAGVIGAFIGKYWGGHA